MLLTEKLNLLFAAAMTTSHSVCFLFPLPVVLLQRTTKAKTENTSLLKRANLSEEEEEEDERVRSSSPLVPRCPPKHAARGGCWLSVCLPPKRLPTLTTKHRTRPSYKASSKASTLLQGRSAVTQWTVLVPRRVIITHSARIAKPGIFFF